MKSKLFQRKAFLLEERADGVALSGNHQSVISGEMADHIPRWSRRRAHVLDPYRVHPIVALSKLKNTVFAAGFHLISGTFEAKAVGVVFAVNL